MVIGNDFEKLSVNIDGVEFLGTEWNDLALVNSANYATKQLTRFTFFGTWQQAHARQTLCHYSFQFAVPQTLIDRVTNTAFDTNLQVDYQLGEALASTGGLEFEKIKLILGINQRQLEGVGEVFETALDQIWQQLNDLYAFKNCYGCLYADYSVYGQSSFGTMLCFVNQKHKYLAITSKAAYMALKDAVKQVQELYCCESYEIRKAGTGYRG
jgi:Family of unknown function (DUF6304)